MDKKSIGHLLFAIIVIFAAIFVLFVYGEGYLRQYAVKNNFQANIKKEMHFLPLDYFNEPEIEKCKALYNLLKNSSDIVYLVPKIKGKTVEYKINNDVLVSENKETYVWGDRKFPVSENTIAVRIGDGYYLISEWFSKDKYVFYYLDTSEEFREVNCRFDVE